MNYLYTMDDSEHYELWVSFGSASAVPAFVCVGWPKDQKAGFALKAKYLATPIVNGAVLRKVVTTNVQ